MGSVEPWRWRTGRACEGSTGKPPHGPQCRCRVSSWRARWRSPEGSSQGRVVRTKGIGERLVATMESSKVDGTYLDARGGRTTLRDWSTQYLATLTASEATLDTYRQRLRTLIWPTLGDKAVADLRPSTIQAWIAELDRSPATVDAALTLLRSVLTAAVEDRLIPSNPAKSRSVRAPRRTSKRKHVWAADHLVGVSEAIGPDWRALVAVGVGCGLRQGELFALKLGDVDFLRRELHVDRQLQWKGGQPFYRAPKGDKTRVVPLPDFVGVALAEHVKRFPDREHLFGQPTKLDWNNDVWKPALRAAGIPDTAENGCHVMRHTFASELLAAGVSIASVSQWLGHSSPAITLRVYSHHVPGSDDRGRRVLDEAFGCGISAKGGTRVASSAK
jgi:integrase